MIEAFFQSLVSANVEYISSQEQAENLVFEAGKKYMFDSGKKYDVSYDVNAENVTIGSYGTGYLPELRASEDISTLDWTDNSGIWSTPMVDDPKWIYINDTVAKWAETDWIQIIDRPALSSLTADLTTLNAFSDIVGATLVAKDQPWRIGSEHTVTAYSSGEITFTPDLVATADDRLGFKLYNKVEFMVDNNEWAWEDEVLYVKSTVSPALLDIRRSTNDYIIKASAPGLTVETVKLNQSYSYNVKIEADNTRVLNCEITNSRGCGILAQQNYLGLNISYNLVEDCALNGIAYGPATSPIIRRNTVRNIGMGENYGWQNYSYGTNTQVVGAGIASYIDPLSNADVCTDAIIEYNNVSNCAYNGIGIHAQQNSIIRKNIVHNYMNRYTDGGGIYLVHYRGHDVLGDGAVIEDNIVYDGNVGLGGYYESDGFSAGVYIDNRVINTIIRRNTIYDIYKAGININWDKKHTQSLDNIIYNCAYGVRYLRGGIEVIVDPDNEENILNNNVILAKDEIQVLLYVVDTNAQGIYNPFAGGGGDNNKYIQPYTDLIGFREDDPNNPDGREVFMTLADIRSRYGIDANSTEKVNYKVTPEVGDIILYTNETDTVANQLIPTGYEDVDGVDVSGQTLEISAYGGLAVIKTI